jgi:hypothetical protein
MAAEIHNLLITDMKMFLKIPASSPLMNIALARSGRPNSKFTDSTVTFVTDASSKRMAKWRP